MPSITFLPVDITVVAAEGEPLSVVAARAGLPLRSDCGGQGVCRRCAVTLEGGQLADKSGAVVSVCAQTGGREVLACQSVVVGDAVIAVPEQSRAADLTPLAGTLSHVAERLAVAGVDHPLAIRRCLQINPPRKGDSLADVERIFDALRAADPQLRRLSADLPTLRVLPVVLRESHWHVCTTVVDGPHVSQLVNVSPACDIARPAFGVAIDVGTSTVALSLVSLETGRTVAAAGKRNAQTRFGDDVISRIIWTEEHDDGLEMMRQAVVQTINEVITEARRAVNVASKDVIAVTCAANSTMMNFLLGIPSGPIRRDPHTPAASWLPLFSAAELELDVWPRAPVFCLPTVSGFVGADITAGVLATGLAEAKELTVLVDVGTNGEIVVGMDGMLVCASCSAGPAFEGVGIECGMHGAPGAIEAISYNPQMDEVSIQVIGNRPPQGICGTGFIDLLGTLFARGVLDRGARFVADFPTRRLRASELGELEFVVAFAGEHGAARDVVVRQSDIENLIRSKAAIHAGIAILLNKLNVAPEAIHSLYLAGAFGSRLDVRRAVQIGLLPDLPPERIHYVGNTSLAGAQLCLIAREARECVGSLAAAMTYVELSVEPGFMEEYVASMFLPHTQTERFPSVVRQTTA